METKYLTQRVILFEGEDAMGEQKVTYDAQDGWVIITHNGSEISASVENVNLLFRLFDKVTQQKGVEYWQKRCELAEKFIAESPCDPDITETQVAAHKEYKEFLKNG